jgi:acetyl-CoA synthetase
LPKTISGKIRRVELRRSEEARHGGASGSGTPAHQSPGTGTGTEYSEADFPGLKSGK